MERPLWEKSVKSASGQLGGVSLPFERLRWDNAVAESFFHTLKTELIHHEDFQTRGEAQQAIFEYIEVFYNRQRKHSNNRYLAPLKYEQKFAGAA